MSASSHQRRAVEPAPGSAALAVLIPVLRRPKQAARVLKSIQHATPASYRVYFICDPDDKEELVAVEALYPQAQRFRVSGNYAAKINYGVELTDEPLIFTGADDLEFHPRWLERALAKMKPGIGVVGTNDLGNPRVMRGETSTHLLITREYAQLGTIDDPTKLMHDQYDHNCPDTELVETARHRGAFAFAEDSHVEHLHPFWHKGEMDPVYERGQQNFSTDMALLKQRRRLWKR